MGKSFLTKETLLPNQNLLDKPRQALRRKPFCKFLRRTERRKKNQKMGSQRRSPAGRHLEKMLLRPLQSSRHDLKMEKYLPLARKIKTRKGRRKTRKRMMTTTKTKTRRGK